MKVSEQKNIRWDILGRLNSNCMQNREAVPSGSKQWGFIGTLAELRLSPVMEEGWGVEVGVWEELQASIHM